MLTDMQAEDKVGAGHKLEVFHDLVVARVRINLLGAPVGKGMRGARNQLQAMLGGQLDHLAAQLVDVFARLVDIAANPRAHLDDGCVHLRLHPLLQAQLALLQHLRLDMRAQIPRHRIDGLVLLFNAKRERWAHARLLKSNSFAQLYGMGGDEGLRDWGLRD